MFSIPSGDTPALTMDIGLMLGLLVMARLLNPAQTLDRVVTASAESRLGVVRGA
jgi:hypothetical protein